MEKIKEIIIGYEKMAFKTFQDPSQNDGYRPLMEMADAGGTDMFKAKCILYQYFLLQAYNIFTWKPD